MSPGEVLDKHTSYELSEWMAFFKLEKIDHDREMEQSKLKQKVAQQRRGRR